MSVADKYFTVEKYSHCFIATHHTPRGHQILMEFASNYVQMGLVRVGRSYRRQPVKVFAARCPKKRQVHFHHGQWKEFMAFLIGQGIGPAAYEIIEYAHYEAADADLKISEGWSPKDYQVPIIDYLNSPEPSPIKLLEIQTGKGKAHGNDESIKTPTGWTTVGQVKSGDMVIDEAGMPIAVTDVYPQGAMDNFTITFTDGRTANSTLDHLWSVVLMKNNTPTAKILSLRDIIANKHEVGVGVHVPLVEPVKGLNEEVPVEPWTLGALIGSGYFSKDKDGEETFRIIQKSNHVIEKLGGELQKLGLALTPDGRHAFKITNPEGVWTQSSLRATLASSDSTTRKSKRAYIPQVYFEATVAIRQAFVCGLMDACGTVDKSFRLTFSTTDEILSEDFTYLIRSLGDKDFVRTRRGKNTHVVHTLRASEYFSEPETLKKARLQPISLTTRLIEVDTIKFDKTIESTCISVEGEEGIYVVGDFVLTHNTYSAAEAIVRNGKRFIIFLKPQFIPKWESDLKKLMGLDSDEVATIRGSAAMMNLIAEAMQGELPYKAIIVSNKTFQNWISAYEEEGDALLEKGYDCHPHQLMQLLKVGLRLIDEVHMDFHLNFKIDLYTHVAKSISLSATLISDDQFIASMQKTAYPKFLRYAGMEYDRYVESVSYTYSLKENVHIQTTERGSDSYSHHAFEKSLYRSKPLMDSYLAMIELLVNKYFVNRKGVLKGDKCLVYVSSIQFATTVVEYLTTRLKTYDVRRYVEDDPYENLLEAEIPVSTVGSAGTGHDIDRLVTVLMSTAISSSSSNIQGFGRLRNLAGKEMLFVYLTCMDIPRHVSYREKKELLLSTMAKVKSTVNHNTAIG